MDLRRVFERHDLLAPAALVPEFRDGRLRVGEETSSVGRVDPCAGDDPSTVAWPHLGLVGVDQRVEGRRVYQSLLHQEGLERPHAEVGFRER